MVLPRDADLSARLPTRPGLSATGARPTRGRLDDAGAALALILALGAGAEAHAQALRLTLEDAIETTLRNNRTLKSARLGRATDGLALEVAEERYRPKATIDATAGVENEESTNADVGLGPKLRLPTGGEVSLRWSEGLTGQDGAWTLGLSQPLLKGFGPEVDTAPVRIARIAEKRKAAQFRDSVGRIVTSAIRAYRRVVKEQRAIAISRESVARAKRQIEINRSLIEAGRMAEREIIRSESELAEREFALAESNNNLTEAVAGLIAILDIDDATDVVAVDEVVSADRRPIAGLEESIETALARRSDYAGAQLAKANAEIELKLAQNDQLWDMRLHANVSRGTGGGAERDYDAGVRLSIPLGDDRAKRLDLVRAKNNLRKAEIERMETLQSIRSEVRQAVHEVEAGLRRIELARTALGLAERQFEVEQAKLAQGLSSAYELTASEDDLVSAQNRELDAAIAYHNALTRLDEVLGTTLERWRIDPAERGWETAPTARGETPVGRSTQPGGAGAQGAPYEPPRGAFEAAGRVLAGAPAKARSAHRRPLMLSLGEFETGAGEPRDAKQVSLAWPLAQR